MAFPYTRAYADWKDFPDTTTPIDQASLDTIEAGIKSLSDILALVDAKGDLIAATGADAYARLAAGANDELPIYDSTQSTGIKKAKIADANIVTAGLTNAAIAAAAGIARSKLAVQTRRYPIHIHTPRSSTLAGNAFWTAVALTDYDAGHWEFVKDVDGKVYGQVLAPAELAGTPNAKIILVTAYNATTGVSRWVVGSDSPADGATLNPAALTDETAQDITVPGTAYFRKDVTFTLTSAPSANDLIIVEIHHNGAHVNDTVAVNSLLFGAYLECDVA